MTRQAYHTGTAAEPTPGSERPWWIRAIQKGKAKRLLRKFLPPTKTEEEEPASAGR